MLLYIFFLILLKYKQDNEIRTTRTRTIIVIINIEEKNEMIRKMFVEIKRFIKDYMVLSVYYATLSH